MIFDAFNGPPEIIGAYNFKQVSVLRIFHEISCRWTSQIIVLNSMCIIIEAFPLVGIC